MGWGFWFDRLLNSGKRQVYALNKLGQAGNWHSVLTDVVGDDIGGKVDQMGHLILGTWYILLLTAMALLIAVPTDNSRPCSFERMHFFVWVKNSDTVVGVEKVSDTGWLRLGTAAIFPARVALAFLICSDILS
ncbi:hypothetical protein MPLDJ20_300004 [Mesorhizobium plurifarium]|uniref:Uncharacterized protein n=1 Tax=Mesorhizobium plurifarium TaxID=69974 RepID=A0A090GNK4_MESPL|nr:hypothetical protein MPLDJ20_300004 [Mesorhizobium plurifarium]